MSVKLEAVQISFRDLVPAGFRLGPNFFDAVGYSGVSGSGQFIRKQFEKASFFRMFDFVADDKS